ncbi:hypothetical protein [Acinetobacter brisouii]|uniref:hypothetical protein n=1 Tax=Acinetobacter brisouii TaxID=396323 RepID=UPI00124CA522|nr:hypothetical protein [Acinetobacter brisouii]
MTIQLDQPLDFGKYKGRTPADMLNSPEQIEYLLWLRSEKHTKQMMPDGTIVVVPEYQTPMVLDLHMILDHVLRENVSLQRRFKCFYTENEFKLWQQNIEAKQQKAERERIEREEKEKQLAELQKEYKAEGWW